MRAKEMLDQLNMSWDTLKKYQKAGIFHPEHPAKEGWTDYTQNDLEALKRLDVLSKAGMTIRYIAKVQNEEISLMQACLERRTKLLETLEKAQSSLELMDRMLADHDHIQLSDVDAYWPWMHEQEKDGKEFMNDWIDEKIDEILGSVFFIECPRCHEIMEVGFTDPDISVCEIGGVQGGEGTSDLSVNENTCCPHCHYGYEAIASCDGPDQGIALSVYFENPDDDMYLTEY